MSAARLNHVHCLYGIEFRKPHIRIRVKPRKLLIRAAMLHGRRIAHDTLRVVINQQ